MRLHAVTSTRIAGMMSCVGWAARLSTAFECTDGAVRGHCRKPGCFRHSSCLGSAWGQPGTDEVSHDDSSGASASGKHGGGVPRGILDHGVRSRNSGPKAKPDLGPLPHQVIHLFPQVNAPLPRRHAEPPPLHKQRHRVGRDRGGVVVTSAGRASRSNVYRATCAAMVQAREGRNPSVMPLGVPSVT